MCDVPHIVKCVRNHLLRHKYAMVSLLLLPHPRRIVAFQVPLNGEFSSLQIKKHKVNFNHYRTLQEVDSKEQLRVVPKLMKEHVSPDNPRKMNVRLTVQVSRLHFLPITKREREISKPSAANIPFHHC